MTSQVQSMAGCVLKPGKMSSDLIDVDVILSR
jgi:hypothetical protein